MNTTNYKKILTYAAYILVIIYAVSFAFADSYDYIMKWGLDFVSALKQGQVTHYYELSQADYNIFIIVIFAMWMLPFDFFMNITGFGYNIILYTVWYKILIVAVLFTSVYFLGKLLKKLGFSEDDVWLGKLLYLASPMTLMGNVGWGQIDLIPMLFVIAALNMFYDKKYIKMCIMFSVACSFKYHVFILVIPFMLLFEKKISVLIKYFAACISVPVVVEFISRIDPYYTLSVGKENTGYIDGILLAYFNHMSIFISCFILICIICYYIKLNDDNRYILIAMPAASYLLFMLFINWHAQWAVYILPFIIIALLKIKDRFISMLLNLGIGIGFFCYQIALWEINGDNYMVEHGIFQLLLGRTEGYHGIPLARLFAPKTWIGQSLIIPCIIFVISAFIIENHKEKNKTSSADDAPNHHNMHIRYAALSFIPSTFFAVSSIAMFCLNI